MQNFDTAREALNVSLNSSGSAMKEHAKWSESLEARLNKLKSTWQSLSQTFMDSNFLKVGIDILTGFVDIIDKIIDKLGLIPTLLGGFAGWKTTGRILSVAKGAGGLKSFSDFITTLGIVFPNAAKGVSIFTTALKGGVGIMGIFKAAASGLWTVVAAHPILAVVAAVGLAITAFVKWGESAEELAEKVGEATSKYKEQYNELTKNKSSFESLAKRYAELSKGVGSEGENVSLTTDEYLEYQDVVNSIANQVPSLIAGYDSQGNAILNCKGNVEELTVAYEKLIKAQNNEILKSGEDGIGVKDIEKDFKNKVKKFDGDGGWKNEIANDSINLLEEALNGKYSRDKIEELFNSSSSVVDIVDALQEEGLASNVHWYSGYDAYWDAIDDAINNNPEKVREIINNFKSDFDAIAEEMRTAAQAALSNALDFSDSKYADMSDGLKNIAKQAVGGLSAEEYQNILDSGIGIEDYVDSVLASFEKLEANGKGATLETALNLRTQFNNGEVSYGEYVNGIRDAGNLIDDLVNNGSLDEKVANQIKLSLNTNEVTDNYDALKKRLTSDEYNIKMKSDEAEKFLNNLTTSEYSVALDLMVNGDVDFSDFDIKSLREYIEKQAKLQEAMNYTIAIDVETESLDALNTAMAESVSGAGLSSEAISALKGRYAELESEGYNLSAMFEETANGIHLNKKAVGELEQKLASNKLVETDKQLGVLKGRYDELTTEIDKCRDAGDRAALYTEQQSIVDKINDLATLASQYEGLTSAYNAWQNAESAGSERDMYESVIEGFETVSDEISRGWVDDGTIKFLELLTGKTGLAGKSGKDLKKIYDDLDDTIKNTTYSIRDFFTVDEDGNSTNTGVYNFLDAVGQLEEEKFGVKNIVKRDKDDNVIGFDFELAGGDEVIADALGISEELVQIMVRAADDAGFVVNLEGAYTQLADLKTEAESARDTLISLQKNGLEKLKGVDVNFDLDAEGNDLVKEQEKAVKLLDKFKKDGKIDLTMEGAQQALDIAEYLTIKLDDLTEPRYMQIDATQVEEDIREPLEDMQEFERLSKEKHLLQLTGDKKKIKEVQDDMDEIANGLEDLDKETKVKLGIDGLTSEEIADKLEKGEIEIPAELSLDVQMSDDLKDMRLMMMNQLGLASDNEVKLKIGYDIDDSVVDSLTDEEKEVVVKYIVENEDEFNKYTEEEKETVVKLIADGVDLDNYEVEDKEAIVNYIANGEEADGWTPEAKDAFVKYLADGGEIDKFDPENKDSWVVYDTDTTKPDSYEADDEDATVVFDKDSSEPDGYIPDDPNATVIFDKDTSAIDSWKPVVSGIAKFTLSMIIPQGVRNALAAVGISVANGTANVDGTAFADGSATKLSGKAFARGNWGTKDSGTALMGEVGREIIVRDGKFFTVGDSGAGFYPYKKGDIIFNHKQTEELFRYGKVTSGGGRGKAFVDGTAFSSGSGGGLGVITKKTTKTKETTTTTTTSRKSSSSSSSSGSGGSGGVGKSKGKSVGSNSNKSSTKKSSSKSSSSSSSSSSDTEKFEESIDWIEIAISRIERAIDKLSQKANNIYKSWTSRNKALVDEIGKVKEEIELQEDAYQEYMNAASGVGLSSDWQTKIKNGEIDISTIKDETLAEKIKDYQQWYEKALDCKDAIEELKEQESSLFAQRLENVSTQYDGILGVIEHEKNMLDEYISQAEAQGHLISGEYYKALANNEKSNLAQLKKEKDAMLKELEVAMASGTITEGSESWYELCSSIDEVTLAIAESQTQLLEYEQTLQQISWEVFDILQDKISAVTEEADFLIELLSNDKLYDDNGQLTNEGSATMGLHGQNYNAYMYQADLVAEEAERLRKQLEEDPYDTELEERYREMIALQQEYILNAEQEKEAIRDLVSEGIELELDALQERIDKYNESIDAARDLYDYQKRVKEQSEEIANLEKQRSAYLGDTSEEGRAKLQQIEVSLKEAREDLEETEYDKFIEDSSALLDELYLEYESLLNMRLDNLDALVASMIEQINMDSVVIGDTIRETADSVGYTLSDSMETIWSSNTANINGVITMYGEKFLTSQTTTNNALNTINTNLQNVITQLNSIAKTNVESANNSSATKSEEAKTPEKPKEENKPTNPPTTTEKAIKVGGKINAGSAKIYDYAGDTSGERQYYRKDPIYKVLDEKNGYLKVRWHKLSSGTTGWFKKSDVKAYATGAKRISSDDMAWTQEEGTEFIVRPSDGAILTPVAKNDKIFNAQASNNLWSMANSPAEFIKDNLNLGVANVPNNSSVQSNYTQHLDKVILNFPNVKNYEEMLSAMQKDRNFEKLINSMTVDRIAGKSSLAKGKSIR